MKVVVEKKKKPGLWANIHAKRKRGEKPAKPGEEGYPEKDQWDKLTKEELEKIISEELLNFLESEESDPKKQADLAVKDAEKIVTAAKKETQAEKSISDALPSNTPEMAASKKAGFVDKKAKEKLAISNLKKAKKAAEEIKEEKSNFQKYVSKKGKGWKVRLLTKGKQSPGSAYPQKAPTERAKSAPPGAGGV